MKRLTPVFVLTLIFSAGTAFAAEEGQVTNLADFGLSGMQVVADAEGMSVRGMGKKNGYHHTPDYNPHHDGYGDNRWKGELPKHSKPNIHKRFKRGHREFKKRFNKGLDRLHDRFYQKQHPKW